MTNKETKDLLSGTELAKELNISAGRISQLIAKLELSDTLIKSGNKKLIPKDTEKSIREYFNSNSESHSSVNNGDSLIAVNEELNKRIEELIKDKEAYRSDIEEQKRTIASLIQSNYSLSNKLELIEPLKDKDSDKDELKDSQAKNNRGFWSRLFGGS
jgi:prefoldin subunit 5